MSSCRLYYKFFTQPLTVWYHQCKTPITQIKWCKLYFEDSNSTVGKQEQVRFSARICEFFAID